MKISNHLDLLPNPNIIKIYWVRLFCFWNPTFRQCSDIVLQHSCSHPWCCFSGVSSIHW